ncbi:OmpH family outer membrane protein [Trichlorobacter lovleyi]|uniref:OmpH family outer membrane protein n=1 Tax=Trichlorobacter lovleyi TaxID=313985 RepID=UPI00223E91CF|nr:OmpH family outer membrane protein [Trichlorobacter lovleyi]QOX80494.1 OmpH family outer membrane protein [Trichlorobacter lovleyi]
MRRFVRSTLCSFFLCLAALTVQAAEQPAAPATPSAALGPASAAPAAQPDLKPVPGLSLLPAAKPAPQALAVAKIGVVDVNKVSTDSAMGKAAQHQIKAQQTKLQKQVEAKRKQLDKFKADTERQLPSLSPQQREAKQREFQKKIEEFQKFGLKSEKELMESQQKLTKGLFEAIGKAADELGRAKGLAAVVINRELLFLGAGVEPLDITADLITLLDGKTKSK